MKKNYEVFIYIGIAFVLLFSVCYIVGIGTPEVQEGVRNMTLNNFMVGLLRVFGY